MQHLLNHHKTSRFVLVVGMFAVILGCAATSVTATFFPVEGPLLKTTPVSPLRVTINGFQNNTGDLALSMPDGEDCKGQWSAAVSREAPVTSGSLFEKYGSNYGTATTVSRGAAVLTCSNGRNFQVEFVTGPGTAHGFGFAEDNRGNVYRVLF